MMQGDSYILDIEILDLDGIAVRAVDVEDVEIVIGHIRKTYASGEVTFDEGSKTWGFPLSQEETFKILPSANVRGQVRIVWAGGDVEGGVFSCGRFHESTSKEVL